MVTVYALSASVLTETNSALAPACFAGREHPGRRILGCVLRAARVTQRDRRAHPDPADARRASAEYMARSCRLKNAVHGPPGAALEGTCRATFEGGSDSSWTSTTRRRQIYWAIATCFIAVGRSNLSASRQLRPRTRQAGRGRGFTLSTFGRRRRRGGAHRSARRSGTAGRRADTADGSRASRVVRPRWSECC